jgi:alkanesulfonate monooxygenase SsuD/methylene tetrahydromethanopterin reductase-like flavin-dependent oxidoreductase (luciferase family)
VRLELGIWDHFERRPGLSAHAQYAEKIALLQEAEQHGYRGYHLAEHHLSPLDLAPSPFLFLAALAQATTTLRVGTLVSILPLYQPVRLVQEVCMLDQLSGGRLDLGVGRGARGVEHEWFGLVPADSRALYATALDELVSALVDGTVAGAPLDVLPVQRPYPPLWSAGRADGAAQRNLNLIGRDAETVLAYRALWEESRGGEGQLNPHVERPTVGITKHLVVAESDAEATAIARRAWPVYAEHWVATSIVTPDGVPFPAAASLEEAVEERGSVLVGSPETVTASLRRLFEPLRALDEVYFAPALQWGDVTRAEAAQSLRLLAEEVAPALAEPASAVRSTG